eukprot:COSAG04_NODE_1014_length_8762_cov_31.342145_4_plen_211_part_00
MLLRLESEDPLKALRGVCVAHPCAEDLHLHAVVAHLVPEPRLHRLAQQQPQRERLLALPAPTKQQQARETLLSDWSRLSGKTSASDRSLFDMMQTGAVDKYRGGSAAACVPGLAEPVAAEAPSFDLSTLRPARNSVRRQSEACVKPRRGGSSVHVMYSPGGGAQPKRTVDRDATAVAPRHRAPADGAAQPGGKRRRNLQEPTRIQSDMRP